MNEAMIENHYKAAVHLETYLYNQTTSIEDVVLRNTKMPAKGRRSAHLEAVGHF